MQSFKSSHWSRIQRCIDLLISNMLWGFFDQSIGYCKIKSHHFMPFAFSVLVLLRGFKMTPCVSVSKLFISHIISYDMIWSCWWIVTCCIILFGAYLSPFYFLLHLKVGPLAAYYQVPLRHILLVWNFRMHNILIFNKIVRNYSSTYRALFDNSWFFVILIVGLWWDEPSEWHFEASAKRRAWLSQWVLLPHIVPPWNHLLHSSCFCFG